MREVRKLTICGLEYRVVVANAEEVHQLAENEGWTSCATNTIYLQAGVPPTRMRDTLMHEVLHAFLEASGVGHLLADRVEGDYDKFEETMIRLLVPSILRLVDENGEALVVIPAPPAPKMSAASGRGKKARKR